MANYKSSAFYKVRKWMISEMYAAGVIRPENYVNASPVIPIQQIPEAMDNRDWGAIGVPSDAPFIVYDLLVPGGYDTEYWNCHDEAMLWIYDYDIDKVMEIKEFLYDLFGRMDLSASDINNFADADSVFKFHYFDIMMGLPTDEADSVLDRFGMNLVLRYQYTRPRLGNGRLA